MAQAAHGGDYHRGDMEISDQKSTFHGFLMATVWGCGYIAMSVALLTLAFAMGMGWWAGLAAFVILGIGVGIVFKLGGAWWALLIAFTILMGLGGLIIPPLAGLMG